MKRAVSATRRRKVAAACAALVAVLTSGCALGPDYQRPAVQLPMQFAGEATTPADGMAPAVATLPADWWTLYGDADLNAFVAKALAANADINQAVARVEQAQALLRVADSALLPTVNAGAQAGHSEVGAYSPNNFSGQRVRGNSFALSLSTAFEIDLWGKLRRATEAARAELLASAAARDTVRLTVAGAVAQTWFAVRSLDEQIAATLGTLKSRADSVRLFAARLQAGAGSRLEADQAEILRADAALQLRELQRQRALAVSQLGALTGDPGLVVADSTPPLTPATTAASTASAAASSVSMVAAAPGTSATAASGAPGAAGGADAGSSPATSPLADVPLPPAGLPSSLLERRPDVRAAEELLVSANAQIGVARAAMFPTLSLTAALGQESTALRTLLDGPARVWSAGFGLAAPLFDGGRNAARTDQAGARQREAVAAYQGAVSTAFREVADALANVRAARASAADVALQESASARAQRLAQARFDAGYAGYLELLDAQRTATAARLALLRNRQSQLNASVELVKALGGGWVDTAARPAAQR